MATATGSYAEPTTAQNMMDLWERLAQVERPRPPRATPADLREFGIGTRRVKR